MAIGVRFAFQIWDAGSGKCLQTLEGHSGPVSSVAFSPDSAWLASASAGGTVKIWDAGSGKCLQTSIKDVVEISGLMDFSPQLEA
jgi:WD40 repeat protein